MSNSLVGVAIDCADALTLAQFWADVLGRQVAGIAPRVERLTGRALLYVDDGDRALAEVRERGIAPSTAVVRRGSLEDVFLRLTGRTLIE